MAFCQELATFLASQISEAEMKKLGCVLLAVAFTGGNAAACNQSLQECMSSSEVTPSTEDASCDTERVQDCTATVAEMEACYEEMIGKLDSLASRASCSTSMADLQSLEQKPASCRAVEAKCPNLFEDDEPAEGQPQ